MDGEGNEFNTSVPPCSFMISAFLGMEPAEVVIAFARDLGGGSITQSVQGCIWHSCIRKADLEWQGTYLKRFLKKLIAEIESTGGVVLDELYEHYASCVIGLKDPDGSTNYYTRVLKRLSFIFPEPSGDICCQNPQRFEVQLRCSMNMLEGNTGWCSIWPSSLFLSEFILSYPEKFAGKRCLELGSGVGLVGICLCYVKAVKVILSDGDLSTLANMKANLELNNISTGNLASDHQNQVHCVHLPWESASENDLHLLAPDIIVGADIIYDKSCLPHLVRLLTTVINCRHLPSKPEHDSAGFPVVYVASVIRSVDTFECFLALVKEANLVVSDITGDISLSNFLPYMCSYQRSDVRMFSIHG